jgi:hypothetical protein
MSNDHTVVVVSKLPKCDFCRLNDVDKDAMFDARTSAGPWGNMCADHFAAHGIKLGLGWGQQLVLGDHDDKPSQEVKEQYWDDRPSIEQDVADILGVDVSEVEL